MKTLLKLHLTVYQLHITKSCSEGLLLANVTFNNLIYFQVHRVSKTSHLWFAITLTLVNGFSYFLAEMLPIK